MTRRNRSAAEPRRRRHLLAMGARIRGQWRYLVRSTDDPFGTLGSTAARGDVESRPRIALVKRGGGLDARRAS